MIRETPKVKEMKNLKRDTKLLVQKQKKEPYRKATDKSKPGTWL